MTPRLNGASDPPEPAQTAMVSIDLLISGVASCTGRVREPKATPFVRSWCGVGGRRFGAWSPPRVMPHHAVGTSVPSRSARFWIQAFAP